MLIGYVSDEYYATLPDVALEFRSAGELRASARSAPSGAVYAELSPGEYEVCLSKSGFGSRRTEILVSTAKPVHFRLSSDRLIGYAWPKWCRAGDAVQFRVSAV